MDELLYRLNRADLKGESLSEALDSGEPVSEEVGHLGEYLVIRRLFRPIMSVAEGHPKFESLCVSLAKQAIFEGLSAPQIVRLFSPYESAPKHLKSVESVVENFASEFSSAKFGDELKPVSLKHLKGKNARLVALLGEHKILKRKSRLGLIRELVRKSRT